MSDLKCFEELLKDLLLGLLSADNVRTFLGVVHTTEIVKVYVAISVFVHYGESFLDVSFAEGVHWTADGSQKFIVVEEARVVIVKNTEKRRDFSL